MTGNGCLNKACSKPSRKRCRKGSIWDVHWVRSRKENLIKAAQPIATFESVYQPARISVIQENFSQGTEWKASRPNDLPETDEEFLKEVDKLVARMDSKLTEEQRGKVRDLIGSSLKVIHPFDIEADVIQGRRKLFYGRKYTR
jgi:hypothetical protein